MAQRSVPDALCRQRRDRSPPGHERLQRGGRRDSASSYAMFLLRFEPTRYQKSEPARDADYSWKSSPFRDPMPSEPFMDRSVVGEASAGAAVIANCFVLEDAAGAGWSGETLSRESAVGMKNRLPVTAVLKSRMRS